MCFEDRCTFGSDCPQGGDGCACGSGGVCDSGLACRRDLCLGVLGTPLVVHGDVRACEVLVEVAGTRATTTFDDHVLGHSRRRGRRVAIAFSARADEALAGTAAHVDADSPRIVSATCFDRLGHRADGASVRFDSPGGTP
jgi:hypothetical protein